MATSSAELTSAPLPAPPPLRFEEVYEEHFPFVWRSVRRLGASEAVIDDLVQEIFLVVHRRLGDWEGKSTMKTWLYGIVRRVVAHHRRTLRRKPSNVASAEAPDFDAVRAPSEWSADAGADRADARRVLHRLLDELDDEKREAFVLSELEQMTIADIAEATGVNPNTMASRIRAARTAFEAALARFDAQEAAR